MPVEIQLLGPPRVTRDGAVVAFDTRKAVALIAHLALAEGPRSREALCALLWPDQNPDRARGALRRTLSTARTAVGKEWIEAVGDGVGLRHGNGLTIDVAQFRALARAQASVKELTQAAAVFSGDLLEGFSVRGSPEFERWHEETADELRGELAATLARLVDQLATRGEFNAAIPHARRRLALDPLHEPAHRDLIRLHGWCGDRAAALEQYRACVRILSHELGVAPLEETVALKEQVAAGILPPRSGSPTEGPRVESTPTPRPAETPLVGRDDELSRLVAAYELVGRHGMLAVIEGEGGIGKTRLARTFVDRVAPTRVLAARCYPDEAGLAYGPVADLLRAASEHPGVASVSPARLAAAAHLVPELADVRPESDVRPWSTGPGAAARLLDAVAAVLEAGCAGAQAGVVLLDDIHAADEATIDAVAYLGRHLAQRGLLLVLTWRSEAVPPGHRLRTLAADLSRDDLAVIVRLNRLSEGDVTGLVGAVLPGGRSTDLARRVYVESEGLPLFVAEYLAALEAGVEPGVLHGEVRDLLEARLSGLSETGVQVLSAAAVLGRSFALDTVRAVSGRTEEETVVALEELVSTGVIREPPRPPYDFSHDKLRALVYERTSRARRRLLHRRVAALLSTGREVDSALVAEHYEQGGDPAAAAHYHRLAAEHAASVYAHADAVEHLEAALALDDSHAAELHARIGDLRTLRGEYAAALSAYETAVALSVEAEPTLDRRLGEVHLRRGEWGRAEVCFRAALAKAPVEALGLRSRIEADLSLTAHRAGDSAQARHLAGSARALADGAGDRRALAQAHNILGILARTANDHDGARRELTTSLALARELESAEAEVAALNNLALASAAAGDLDQAQRLTEAALVMAESCGDRHREAALRNNLADVHHAAGRGDLAMAELKRAVAIFSEIGADDAERLPEIWKLASW